MVFLSGSHGKTHLSTTVGTILLIFLCELLAKSPYLVWDYMLGLRPNFYELTNFQPWDLILTHDLVVLLGRQFGSSPKPIAPVLKVEVSFRGY